MLKRRSTCLITPTSAPDAHATPLSTATLPAQAAARNAALAHSTAAWNLILDADERLAEDAAGAQALAEATRGPATRIGLLPVIRAFDLEDQVAHSTSWLPRLLPEMPHWQQSPDFFFVLGDLLLDWATAHPAQAEQEFLSLVESAWSTCLVLGEQPQLEGSVQGRGSFLAAHNLAVLHEQMGRVEQARQYQQLARALREGQGQR